ncbi:MAG: hypothetical protein KJ002_09985, partial [Candidatus Dadabacteria bacterium]|nr:hypothetical protein [Candidatus Dadabacteria bacterium]
EAWKSMSPEQMQQTVGKWMEWVDGLEKSGNLKLTGERLSENGKVVKGKSKTVTDGPYVEVKDFIQGYMVVSAESIEQAAEFAKDCPILESDGSVEIRPFMQM